MDSGSTIKPATEKTVDADPIAEAQNAVLEAKALLQCIDASIDPSASAYNKIDLMAAISGVIRILDEVGSDLDPMQFRRAVLASAEVAHG
jgi:hypothetical protein